MIMSTLTIQLPGSPPVAHVLQEETVTIGRMEGNTIVVDDASVSMFHAKITRKDGAFFVKDLNSTNGTFVNGQPVREARLKDLDKVRFADVFAQFQADPADRIIGLTPAQPAPAAGAASKPVRPPAAPFNAGRFFASLAPYLGGIAALGVVSLLIWKLVHTEKDGSENSGKPGAPASIASVKPNQGLAADGHAAAAKANLVTNSGGPVPAATEAAGESVADLVKALNAPTVAERRRAATALHSLGAEAKSATPALRVSLKDSDPEVRMWAALTLINNESYDKAAVPILVGALHHDNAVIRQVACLSLGLIPYEPSERESVIPALAQAAGKDTDEDVRKAALSALSVIDPEAGAKVGGK